MTIFEVSAVSFLIAFVLAPMLERSLALSTPIFAILQREAFI